MTSEKTIAVLWQKSSLPRIAAAFIATALTMCGCNKQPDNAAPPLPVTTAASADPQNSIANLKPVNPEDSADAQEKARLAAIAAMRRGDPPPPPAMKLRGGELATPEVLAAYNHELLRVRIQERRSPENLEELIQKWIKQWKLLPRLPTAPSGKRIVYDDVNCIITLDPP